MQRRFPAFRELVPVYAVILSLLCAWTMVAFLWKLPAWLLMLNSGEILTIFSYSMFTNLLESLFVLLILLIACVVLPARMFRDNFMIRGTILAFGLIGTLMTFLGSYMQFGPEKPLNLVVAPLFAVLLTIYGLIFALKRPSIRSAALWISDRLTIFLFILVPLTLLCSVYVLFRLIA